jgi:hypothetical protein
VGVTTVFDPFLGFANELFAAESEDRSHTETKLGLNGGGGITYAMGRASLFAEARYNDVFTDNHHTTMTPIRIGVQW